MIHYFSIALFLVLNRPILCFKPLFHQRSHYRGQKSLTDGKMCNSMRVFDTITSIEYQPHSSLYLMSNVVHVCTHLRISQAIKCWSLSQKADPKQQALKSYRSGGKLRRQVLANEGTAFPLDYQPMVFRCLKSLFEYQPYINPFLV